MPIDALFAVADKLIGRLLPDPKAAADARLKLMELQQAGELQRLSLEAGLVQGQLEINKIEAASPNMFIAGGRPFIIWVCGFAMAYASILDPLLHGRPPDTAITTQVLLGLLGLGGLRTFEKIKGAEGNR